MPLRMILRAAMTELKNGWLFLPKGEQWTLDTGGVIIDLDDPDAYASLEPRAIEDGLIPTLDSPTIEDITASASDSGLAVTDQLLFDAFMFYWKNDVFMEWR